MTDDEKVALAQKLFEDIRKLDNEAGAMLIVQNLGEPLSQFFLKMALPKMLNSVGPVDAAGIASGLMTIAYLIAKKECGQLVEPQWIMKGADA